MTVKFSNLALPLLVLLAGCGGDAPADDGRAASGEVLEGSISDDMLPLDRLRSEPPPEDPRAFAETRRADGEGAAAAEAGDAEDSAEEPADADASEPAEAADTADE